MKVTIIGWVAAFACMAAMTGAQARETFDNGDFMRDLFRSLEGERVALHWVDGRDRLSVSTRADGGEWTICQVGVDFVRFCHRERDESVAYPITDLDLRTKAPKFE